MDSTQVMVECPGWSVLQMGETKVQKVTQAGVWPGISVLCCSAEDIGLGVNVPEYSIL